MTDKATTCDYDFCFFKVSSERIKKYETQFKCDTSFLMFTEKPIKLFTTDQFYEAAVQFYKQFGTPKRNFDYDSNRWCDFTVFEVLCKICHSMETGWKAWYSVTLQEWQTLELARLKAIVQQEIVDPGIRLHMVNFDLVNNGVAAFAKVLCALPGLKEVK